MILGFIMLSILKMNTPLPFWFGTDAPNSQVETTHDTYQFCGCSSDCIDIANLIFLENLIRMKALNDFNYFYSTLNSNFECKDFLHGFIGIFIDYLNRFSPRKNNIENIYLRSGFEMVRAILRAVKNGQNDLYCDFIPNYLKIPDKFGYDYITLEYMNKLSSIEYIKLRDRFIFEDIIYKNLSNDLLESNLIEDIWSIISSFEIKVHGYGLLTHGTSIRCPASSNCDLNTIDC